MSDRWVRTHKCLDQGGRPRTMEIIAEGGVVILRPPPGEVATFQPDEVGPLRVVLADAQAQALRQRGEF